MNYPDGAIYDSFAPFNEHMIMKVEKQCKCCGQWLPESKLTKAVIEFERQPVCVPCKIELKNNL